jgi:hypothetical protein
MKMRVRNSRSNISVGRNHIRFEENLMSVSSIYGSATGNQISATSISALRRNEQPQTLSQNLSDDYLSSDAATFQMSTNDQAGSSARLTPAQQAYDSLQRVPSDPRAANLLALPADSQSVDPFQVGGSPTRALPIGTNLPNPPDQHDPMPPVHKLPVGLPNPIKAHDPMPPIFKSPISLPTPIRFHDPLQHSSPTLTFLV